MKETLIHTAAWPLAFVLIACFAIWLFRRPITDLIRASKVNYGKDGLSISQEPGAVQQEVKPDSQGLKLPASLDANATARLDQIKNFGMSPLVLRQEAAIRADLRNVDLADDNLNAVTVLVRQLAVEQLLRRAETTYRLIFGNQIAALHYLNLQGGASRSKIMEFLEAARSKFPKEFENYSDDQYIPFLEGAGLITSTKPDHYQISEIGRAFLEWMVSAGISPMKPL